jgi:hypothetical protein
MQGLSVKWSTEMEKIKPESMCDGLIVAKGRREGFDRVMKGLRMDRAWLALGYITSNGTCKT